MTDFRLLDALGEIVYIGVQNRLDHTMRLHAVPCLLLLCFLSTTPALTQEVDCTIQVNMQSLSADYVDKLRDFSTHVKEYIANRNWGAPGTTDKIPVTIDIFFKGTGGENRYIAQIFVGSQRPIHKSNQNTAVLRLYDEYWEFDYLRTIPLVYNPYVFNNLTSVLDFYIQLVLGLDYDTYDRLSGTPMLQKAYEIANLGRAGGAKDWQASTSGYSRIQLIEELLNPKFEPIRVASWVYHFTGLDSLASSKQRAQKNMLRAIELIGATKKQVDVRNLVIKAFFDTKYQEIASVFSDYPDPNVYYTFARIDPPNQTTYESFRQKRR